MSDMSRRMEDLYEEASQLTENDRAELAGRLLESLDGEPDPAVEMAWATEIERRIKEIENGEVELIPWETVREELWRRSNEAK